MNFRPFSLRLLPLALLAACTEPTARQPEAAETPASAPAAPGLRTAAYAGEYNWGDTTRTEAGGTLTVYPESDSTVLLYLDISNGPPAFHLGQLYQRATVRQGVGRCAFKGEYDSLGCELQLAFSSQAVVIRTEVGRGECGFGQGVYADETYRRTSAAVPQQFDDGGGRKVVFKTTSPEQYSAAGQ
ncbi:hypothetical protein Q5H93_06665 [Hymenobacter sp. ASUV-10]|uniref:Lipoprotein n=1 Tax=Hymenobacter aranciens TaxID=3063996 RepID=A0ABT9B812_9BACT|nr:hypothetical protein [Hymenobacter sp. ASUV-10]MDO7874409.1 hypothetical protein [Hymenobacter sp. ASUV-10]